MDYMAKNEILMQYSAAIVFLLAVSYVLLITNPPSDLLQFNENKAPVYRQLSNVSDLQEHGASFSVFFGFFVALSLSIALMTSIVIDEKIKHRFACYSISAIFVILTGLLLYPYYGILLLFFVIPTGVAVYLGGILFFSTEVYASIKYFLFPFELVIASLLLFSSGFFLFMLKLLSPEGFGYFFIMMAFLVYLSVAAAEYLLLKSWSKQILKMRRDLKSRLKQTWKTLRNWGRKTKFRLEKIWEGLRNWVRKRKRLLKMLAIAIIVVIIVAVVVLVAKRLRN
jgi:hypothetical protein